MQVNFTSFVDSMGKPKTSFGVLPMSFCVQGNFLHLDLDIHDFARDALHV